jgi:aspartate/methionine/tyrosine aminotransferase
MFPGITPGNPTASVISSANLRAVARIAQERGLIVVGDEIYENMFIRRASISGSLVCEECLSGPLRLTGSVNRME